MTQEPGIPQKDLFEKAEQWMQSKGQLHPNDSSMYSIPQSSYEDDSDRDSRAKKEVRSSTRRRQQHESISSRQSSPDTRGKPPSARKSRKGLPRGNPATPTIHNNDTDTDWDDYGTDKQASTTVLDDLDPIPNEIPLLLPKHGSSHAYPKSGFQHTLYNPHKANVPEFDLPRPAPVPRLSAVNTPYHTGFQDNQHLYGQRKHNRMNQVLQQQDDEQDSPIFLPQNIPRGWVIWLKRLVGAVICGVVIAVIFIVTEPSFLQEPVASDVLVAPLSASRTAFVVGMCMLLIVIADAIDVFLRGQKM